MKSLKYVTVLFLIYLLVQAFNVKSFHVLTTKGSKYANKPVLIGLMYQGDSANTITVTTTATGSSHAYKGESGF
ncbi:MAG: hypothetical protein ACE5R6_19010 [Candidatus Heimdallarchaeota archaeon]